MQCHQCGTELYNVMSRARAELRDEDYLSPIESIELVADLAAARAERDALKQQLPVFIEGSGCNIREEFTQAIYRADRAEGQLATARAENERLTREVTAVLDCCGKHAIHVREGNGDENVAASLAVTVSALRSKLAAALGTGEEE